MNRTTDAGTDRRPADAPALARRAAPIPVLALGMSLGLFLVISYALCVLLYLLFPELVRNHTMLALLLPGFELLDWRSFILGLVESFGYGWYVALLFGPLYNLFAARSR